MKPMVHFMDQRLISAFPMLWRGNFSVQHYRFILFTPSFLYSYSNVLTRYNQWCFTAGLPTAFSFQVVVLCWRWSEQRETCYDTQSHPWFCWANACYPFRTLQGEMAFLAKSASINCLPCVREIRTLCASGSLVLYTLIFVGVIFNNISLICELAAVWFNAKLHG